MRFVALLLIGMVAQLNVLAQTKADRLTIDSLRTVYSRSGKIKARAILCGTP